MQYEAIAKYVHLGPRKTRLVADAIRTLSPSAALGQLNLLPKRAVRPLIKVINSALDNAQQHQADTARLRLVRIEVMGGPTMKRWRAVARGQAHPYKKRTSHIRVVLSDETGETAADKRVLKKK